MGINKFFNAPRHGLTLSTVVTYTRQVAHQAGAHSILKFCSMKGLEIVQLPTGWSVRPCHKRGNKLKHSLYFILFNTESKLNTLP